MLPEIKCVEHNNLRLEYYVYGDGADVVVCMHGHGRSPEDFAFIASTERKVIALHLFYHGNSYFPEHRIENDPLKLEEFSKLFELIIQAEKVGKFHLFAFSQGGRFSLCIFPFFYQMVKSFTLISPDGLDNSSFYNWSSRRSILRKLLIHFEKHPHRLRSYVSFLEKIKLVRPQVKSFVHEFSSHPEQFHRASLTWRAFRNLHPNAKLVGKTIRDNKIPFRIIMGKFDQVIRPRMAYSFEKKCGLTNIVVEIENGHNFFKASAVPRFVHLLPFMK
ncbi:MAG: alpha/beta fold hydrolase [Bacteroidota bacterium]